MSHTQHATVKPFPLPASEEPGETSSHLRMFSETKDSIRHPVSHAEGGLFLAVLQSAYFYSIRVYFLGFY